MHTDRHFPPFTNTAKQAKMSQMPVYGNINTHGSWGMNTHQEKTPQQTGSDSMRNRCSRAVCLGLLCVLLLTAVIVLCLHIHTKSTNYTEERDQPLTNITNLTEDRDGLKLKNENLTNENEQLIFKNKNLMSVRDQLRNERDQLINERDQLRNERDQLRNERDQLRNERDQLNELLILDGWTYYQSSFYYMPNEKKSWTESRRYCTERGADLIIINNREEQDFVNKMSGAAVVYIGLTDRDVENTWKWEDGTSMTYRFWASAEPNGKTLENCVVTVAVPTPQWSNLVGWVDVACDRAFKWICERKISQLPI